MIDKNWQIKFRNKQFHRGLANISTNFRSGPPPSNCHVRLKCAYTEAIGQEIHLIEAQSEADLPRTLGL
jgi:hypothetical protein